ncbi:integral membrane protein [Actinomadura sp. NBRC 104425]|uniref:DoxX family protein n=1 Tax=Actinomadura sp. NBRC 104425 TaxID=3032204 RepID=UPI00249FC0EA|nr:DoxX family protein [Actinomadura sp. NBRC 104425]GLZ13199.1 integral membrane protein [Actinomadura sp. NBRC 104425]
MQHVRDAVLSLFRVVVGLLFACHGAAKLFGVLGGPPGGVPPRVGEWPSWWAAMIELVGGGLVMIGLATRPAALLCSGAMAYAYFTVHLPKDLFPLLNGGEPAALFSWSFLLLAVFGGGPWALDALIARRVRPGKTVHRPHPRRTESRAHRERLTWTS